MDERELPVLGDKNIFPSDDIIFSLIGDKKIIWQTILEHANNNYKDIISEWRYYNDGKQWLFKLQHKKKTVFWAGVLKDTMRITFYFGNKAEPLIRNSSLPDTIKDNFASVKRFGTLKPITIPLHGLEDLEIIYKLIRLKTSLK